MFCHICCRLSLHFLPRFTLLLTKEGIAIYEAVFFRFEGEVSRKTTTPSYLELTSVRAEILPLSGQCDPLPRTVDFVF